MNDIRQQSLSFTAKKHAYRQSRDGFLLTLLLNPAEDLDRIAVADLGTPYAVAMHEIDDNDQPVSQGAANSPAPGSEPLTARAAAAKHAGMRCREMRFRIYLKERFSSTWDDVYDPLKFSTTPEVAAEVVRRICQVVSRKEFSTDPDAFNRWCFLESGYQAWLRT